MAARDDDNFIVECALQIEHSGTPPALFSEFLEKFTKSTHYRILTTPTSIFLLKIAFTAYGVCYEFINDRHYLYIYLNNYKPNNSVSLYRDDTVIIDVQESLFSEILVHLGCYISSLLRTISVNQLDFFTQDYIDNSLIIGLKTLLLTPMTETVVLRNFRNKQDLEIILENIDTRHFITIDTYYDNLDILFKYLDRFQIVNNVKLTLLNYYLEVKDKLRQLLKTKIRNFTILLDNKYEIEFKNMFKPIIKEFEITDFVYIYTL
jgi:hypothetical protein